MLNIHSSLSAATLRVYATCRNSSFQGDCNNDVFESFNREAREGKKKKKGKDVLETSSVAMKTLHQHITLTNIS